MTASEVTAAYKDADLGGKILLPGPALHELMGGRMGSFGYGYGGLGDSGHFTDSPMVPKNL